MKEAFGDKQELIGSNARAIKLGHDYVVNNFEYPLDFRVEARKPKVERIMVDGNTAAALGCVYAGATVGSWYPITPSTSLFDAFDSFCKRMRRDEKTGKNNYCIIQAEDEQSNTNAES